MDQEPGANSHPEYTLTQKVIRDVSKGKYNIDISRLDERSVVCLRGLLRDLVDEAARYKKSFKRRKE